VSFEKPPGQWDRGVLLHIIRYGFIENEKH